MTDVYYTLNATANATLLIQFSWILFYASNWNFIDYIIPRLSMQK